MTKGDGTAAACRAGLFAGVAVVAAMAAARPAAAFTLFGHHFFEKPAEAADLSPDAQRYAVSIALAGGDDGLKAAVEGASALWSGRDEPPPPSVAAFLSRVEAEYGRITAALYQAGHYGGAVTITVDGRDPDAIAADASLPQPVPVVISVDPGPLFRFGRLTIDGAPPPGPEDQAFKVSTPADAGFVAGRPAEAGVVLKSEKLLVDAWRRRGYPLATVLSRDTVANHDSSTLDVALRVDPGPRADFGPIKVTGTANMDAAYTAYMTGISPGMAYRPAIVERAQKNLRRLNVFSSQRIEQAKALDADGRLPMTLAVAERPRHVIGGGVSYSTLDGAGLEGYWQHRNLFGKAESLKLSGSVSGIDSTDPSDFTYKLSADFMKPGVFTPFTDFTAGFAAGREVLDSYTENSIGAKVGLSHAVSEALAVSLGLSVIATSDEDADGTQRFLMASLPGEITFDNRDDKTDPHAGVNALAHLEPFYEVRYGNGGVIAKASAASYLALDAEGQLVLAGRLAAGSILGAPAGELPNSRLFYAGGGASVRGYAYRTLGPTNAAGEVTGGRSFVEGSLELRARVSETFGLAVFADAGNAFRASYPDFAEGVKIAAGAGVRYYTGLGPIRLDVALPLDQGPNDSPFALYVGLGQSF